MCGGRKTLQGFLLDGPVPFLQIDSRKGEGDTCYEIALHLFTAGKVAKGAMTAALQQARQAMEHIGRSCSRILWPLLCEQGAIKDRQTGPCDQ